MLFKNNIGLKIEKDFVGEIIIFLINEGWIKNTLKIENINGTTDFACGWGKHNKIDVLDTILIPKVFYTDKYVDNERIMALVYGLKELYNFDLVEIAERNNIPLDKMITLFCILHEIGHSIDSHKQVLAFKKHKSFFKERDLRNDIGWETHLCISLKKDIIHNRDRFDKITLNYRKLTTERIADRYAIKFLRLYEEELCAMASKLEYESIVYV